MMRQAGRYLPEYRAVRATTDFLTLCKTPELAAEVTIQPVDLVGVDAAIIFSDILVIPEALGMELVVEEGKGGPRFPNPIRTEEQIASLNLDGVEERLRYVYDAEALTRKNLDGRVPLIGFAGAPWTLATYMIEGGGSRHFAHVKRLLYACPDKLHRLLDTVTEAAIRYLRLQVREGGVDIVQIFDTWAGILAKKDFLAFSLPYMERIVREIQAEGVPVILFPKGATSSLREIAATGADAISLDWTVEPAEARSLVPDGVALQGNLDPVLLYADTDTIARATRDMLQSFGTGPGHIVNLGHGILPDIPVDHARAFVRAAKEFSLAPPGTDSHNEKT